MQNVTKVLLKCFKYYISLLVTNTCKKSEKMTLFTLHFSRTCAYKLVRNVIFSESFPRVCVTENKEYCFFGEVFRMH